MYLQCLDVTNGVNEDGTKLQIWTCIAGNTNQMWNANADGTYTWAGTNKYDDLYTSLYKNSILIYLNKDVLTSQMASYSKELL